MEIESYKLMVSNNSKK